MPSDIRSFIRSYLLATEENTWPTSFCLSPVGTSRKPKWVVPGRESRGLLSCWSGDSLIGRLSHQSTIHGLAEDPGCARRLAPDEATAADEQRRATPMAAARAADVPGLALDPAAPPRAAHRLCRGRHHHRHHRQPG